MGTCQCPGQAMGPGGGLPCGLCWPSGAGGPVLARVLAAPGKESEERVTLVGQGRREAGKLPEDVGWDLGACGGLGGLSLEGPGELAPAPSVVGAVSAFPIHVKRLRAGRGAHARARVPFLERPLYAAP